MLEFIKKRRFFICMFLVSLLSVGWGAVFLKSASDEALSTLSTLLGAELKSTSASFGDYIFSSVVGDMVVIFLVYLLGFSPISTPFICALVMFSSFGAGLSIGYTYLSFSTSALIWVAVLMAPKTALCILAICLSAECGAKLSHNVFSCAFKNSGEKINIKKIYKYSLNFLKFSCIIIISGVLDAFLNKFFSNVITL